MNEKYEELFDAIVALDRAMQAVHVPLESITIERSNFYDLARRFRRRIDGCRTRPMRPEHMPWLNPPTKEGGASFTLAGIIIRHSPINVDVDADEPIKPMPIFSGHRTDDPEAQQ